MADELLWYGSIFGWLFLTGVGLPPVPEEVGILYAAGLHALHPEVRWPLAWAACGLGIIAADLVLYAVGRRWGVKLFEYRWVQKVLKKERRERLEGRFHRHGFQLLLLARFLPPLRTGVFLIAGAAKYPVAKFLAADLAYAVVGVGLFFLGGSWVVGLLDRARGWAGGWGWAVLAVPATGYGLYRYYRYLRGRELSGGAEPPVSVLDGVAGAVPDGQPATRPGAAPAAAAASRELMSG